MDVFTLTGIAFAFIAILGGNVLEGGHLSALVNLPAFVIVIGGTIAAGMVHAPQKQFVAAFKQLAWLAKPPAVNLGETAKQLVNWGGTARRGGLNSLDGIIKNLKDPFQIKALQLLVDGVEPQHLRSILETEVALFEEEQKKIAKIWGSMGGYSPTIGILGAVLGLIHVMQNLSDPSKLGPGIATAFVATIYGVGIANLLFLPFSNKLVSVVEQLVLERSMVMEAILAIAEGVNTLTLESKVRGFLGDE